MSDIFDIENDIAHGQLISPPTLFCHESAHSIVFRDQIRRQSSYSHQTLDRKNCMIRSLSIGSSHSGRLWNENGKGDETPSDTSVSSGTGNDINLQQMETGSTPTIIITANFTPHIEPLEALPLNATDEFHPLLSSNPICDSEMGLCDENLSYEERSVVMKLQEEQCVVKTIRNQDWNEFLRRFNTLALENDNLPYNTFKTSTSLLPSRGMKMRCYGSSREYSHGVIFALPVCDLNVSGTNMDEPWCWPSGYSAKTEFNIDEYGNLINGRNEARVTLEKLRKMNHSFINDNDYEIAGKWVKGGLNTVPYNEVYVRVGGFGRETDKAMGESFHHDGVQPLNRSYSQGLGIPVSLFSRSATYKDLIGLLRLRAKMGAILGKLSVQAIPLLFITPDLGVKVLTDKLQTDLLRIMSSELNPFQNSFLQNKTSIDNLSEQHLQEKRDELFNLDDDNIRSVLTTEECARLAGGFGATDESVAHLLMNAMLLDSASDKQRSPITEDFIKRNKLQDLVNEGLCGAVRSGDYHTARQLLILYSLVASKGEKEKENPHQSSTDDTAPSQQDKARLARMQVPLISLPTIVNTTIHNFPSDSIILATKNLLPPPPPPLDTDRLRFATNSDGLLAVLGAAEILRSIRDGVIKRRAEEVVQALEEWLNKSDSITFRLQSWRNQKAAQGERKIATEQESNLMAFISSKAINNRKVFIDQLRTAIDGANFRSISFLKSLHTLVTGLHAPCLRLELLQYILNLDNRFSIAHVARSLELSATCLSVCLRESHSVEIYSEEERERVCIS